MSLALHEESRVTVYPLNDEQDGAIIFDTVSLESAWLSPVEARRLLSLPDSGGGRLASILARHGIDVNVRESNSAKALLARLRSEHQSAMPNRVGGLRIYLTDRCNMACSYCFVPTNTGNPDLRIEHVVRSLEFLFSQHHKGRGVIIQWFGGEPTLAFPQIQTLDQIIDELARRSDCGAVDRNLVTNGLRVTDEMLDHFARYNYGIGISIDGPPAINAMERRRLGRHSAEDAIRRTIVRYRDRNRLRLGINVTPTCHNFDRLQDVVDYSVKDLGIDFIFMNFPVPVNGRWNFDGEIFARSVHAARWRAQQFGATFYSGLERIYSALASRRPQVFDHLEGDGSAFLAVLPNGRISLSEISAVHAELQTTLDDLIYDRGILSRAAKDLTPLPGCSRCPAFGVCGGPPLTDRLYRKHPEPDPDFCKFVLEALRLCLQDWNG